MKLSGIYDVIYFCLTYGIMEWWKIGMLFLKEVSYLRAFLTSVSR